MDPNFALALANFSQLESWIFHTYEPTPAQKDKARTLADRALQMEPELSEGHLALGFTFYYGDRDYENALKEFGIAQRGLPNNADAYLAIGAIERRQGKWLESNVNLEKATSPESERGVAVAESDFNYQMLRDFPLANKTIDRALKLKPDSLSLWSIKAQLEVADKGTFETFDRGIKWIEDKSIPDKDRAKLETGFAQVSLLQRKYAEAVEKASKISDEMISGDLETLCRSMK